MRLDEVIGCVLRRDVAADTLLEAFKALLDPDFEADGDCDD